MRLWVNESVSEMKLSESVMNVKTPAVIALQIAPRDLLPPLRRTEARPYVQRAKMSVASRGA